MSPKKSIVSPDARVTIAFLYEGLRPCNTPFLVLRDLRLPGITMVLTASTLTVYNCSTAFLISILFTPLSTIKLYWLFDSERPSAFSVIKGLTRIILLLILFTLYKISDDIT